MPLLEVALPSTGQIICLYIFKPFVNKMAIYPLIK
jgi:hypothetical protein